MFNWKPKLAEVDPDNPIMWATCARCGFITNHNKMVWQYDYRGTPSPINTRILTCGRPSCLDVPQVQNSPIILPPDPEPVFNARPYPYELTESWMSTQDGDILDTQDGLDFITAIPNPSDYTDTVYLSATFDADGASVSTLYLDLFNGCPVYSPTPTTFSHSPTYGNYSGADRLGFGMRDGLWNAANTVWGSVDDSSSYITADYGRIATIASISVAPIPEDFEGWGPAYLIGATVAISSDAVTWTNVTVVEEASNDTYTTVRIAADARYVRLSRSGEYLGVGDFIVNCNTPPPGVSILAAITGSATRISIGSDLTTTNEIATNTDSIVISTGSESVTNVNWAGLYSAASGGTLLMYAEITARDHVKGIGVDTAVVIPALGIRITEAGGGADMESEMSIPMVSQGSQYMITE